MQSRLIVLIGSLAALAACAGLGLTAAGLPSWPALAALGLLPLAVRAGLQPLKTAQETLFDLQQSVLRMPRELEPFRTALTMERERLNALRSREGSYFSEMAHEFRTRLSILQARVDMTVEPGARQDFETDIERMVRLIDQMKTKGKLRLRDMQFARLDLAETVRAVVHEQAPLAFYQGKALDCQGTHAPVIATANRTLIEDSLRNLIRNAIQYSPDGGTIEVSLDETGQITVRDHGPGIPELLKDELFQPFARRRDQSHGGAGLGLAIVRETALLHNGRVTAANHGEGGAIFSFSVPVDGARALAANKAIARDAVQSFWKRNADRASFDFSAVVEFSQDAIYNTDARGLVTNWNPAAEKLLGYSAAEMIGKPAAGLLAPQRERDPDLIRERLVQGLQVQNQESVLQRKDGSLVPVSLNIWPVYSADGRGVGTTGIARDLSERRKSQTALQEKVHLLSTITDNAVEAMFMSDEQGRVTFMNRAAEQLSGWSFAELQGRFLHDAIHHTRRDGGPHGAGECPLQSVYQTRRPLLPFDDTLVHRDGHFIDVAFSSAPILVGDAVTGSVLVVRDITERKKAETALRHTQKMNAIGNLTGGMAHDFNNVLAIVIANLDALTATLGDVEADAQELARDALDAALSGSELTRRLLAFARRQALYPEVIEVNALVENTTRLLSRTLGADIEIELQLAVAAGSISADPVQLESSLTNLAANARDAMPRGGRLVFSTRNEALDQAYETKHTDVTPGEYVVLEISDTGAGMSDEVIARIFEPFFSTKDEHSGTGLGLSMVFGFMKQSGGHVAVSSKPGQGSSFRLYFPRLAEERSKRPAARQAPPTVAKGGGETVLAVEDNPALRRILLRHLKDFGYRTLEAVDAADALRILAANKVDLIVTDVVMPGMSGAELAELALEKYPGIRVVVTSGFPDLKLNRALNESASIRLLAKPYRQQDLARVIAQALERRELAAASI